jgi:3-hydroxyisobutyrate dehydrogenase-like beta-hydroxyacid dehydrogenase
MQARTQDAERVAAQRESRRVAALQNILEELHKERALNGQFQRRISECVSDLDEVKAAHKQLGVAMESAKHVEACFNKCDTTMHV